MVRESWRHIILLVGAIVAGFVFAGCEDVSVSQEPPPPETEESSPIASEERTTQLSVTEIEMTPTLAPESPATIISSTATDEASPTIEFMQDDSFQLTNHIAQSIVVSSVAWSPDGQQVVVGGIIGNGTSAIVATYDVDSGEQLNMLAEGIQASNVQWSPLYSNRKSYIGALTDEGDDIGISIWDAATQELITRITSISGQLYRGPNFNPTTPQISTLISNENTITLTVDFLINEPLLTVSATSSAIQQSSSDLVAQVEDVAWSNNGTTLAVSVSQNCQEGGRIIFWNTEAEEVAQVIETTSPVGSISWSNDDSFLASVPKYCEGPTLVWGVESGELVGEFSTALYRLDVAFSQDDMMLAVVNLFGPISLIDISSGDTVETLSPEPGSSDAYSVSWSPDGTQLATEAAPGGGIAIWTLTR